MTDINEWNLSYPKSGGAAVDFDFGYSGTSPYPFSVQMEIGDADRVTNDIPLGVDDGMFQGVEQLTGMDLTFTLTTLPADEDMIIAALDAASEFQGVWRASQVMKQPGAYAILTNILRNRYVIGRPRNFSRKQDRLRKGTIGYVAQFRTISPEFYQFPQRVVSPVRNVATLISLAGDVPAYPFITFTGKFTTATLTYSPGGLFLPWSITCNHSRNTGNTFTIDTRPTNRGAYTETAGEAANGWLAGSRLSDCFFDPDAPGSSLTFTTTGATDGSTRCSVEWFDTYAGL